MKKLRETKEKSARISYNVNYMNRLLANKTKAKNKKGVLFGIISGAFLILIIIISILGTINYYSLKEFCKDNNYSGSSYSLFGLNPRCINVSTNLLIEREVRRCGKSKWCFLEK